ncbi:hypothetical protein [Kitasatospora sp. KL5]|uniref:hypothetical protein n=1 Tax=Kitasatospora sp. KL5 TaxID=3425125 RepID=UPI003D6E2B6B
MTVIVSVDAAGCGCAARRPWSPSPPPGWARAAGTSLARWAAPGCTASPYGGHGFAPAERAPVAGEVRMVGMDGPFLAEGPFWCLFAPPSTVANCAPDCPEELPAHAMVRCTPLAVADARPGGAWVQVSVDEVVGLTEAQQRWAPSAEGSVTDWLPPEGAGVARTSFRYVEWSAQGDLGWWAVLREDGDRPVLLLAESWSFDGNDVAMGHRPLTDGEAAAVLACWPPEG